MAPDLARHEQDRRRQLEELAKAFAQLRDAYAQAIAGDRQTPLCPQGSTMIVAAGTGAGADPADVGTPLCVPIAPFATPGDPAALTDLADSLLLPLAPGATSGSDFGASLARLLGVEVEQLAEDNRQRGLELLQQGYRLSVEGNERALLALGRLGPLPREDVQKTASLDFDLTKTCRTGTVLQFLANARGIEESYLGKPLDPRFGGREVQNTFTTTLALVASQPLGQGRGANSTAGPERAAQANARAAQAQYQHVVSRQALETISAYVDVVAAQASLALLEASAVTNRKIQEGTYALVKAGEKARSELDRIAARVLEVEGSISGARLGLVSARAELATAMGVAAGEAGVGPLATESFDVTPGDVDLPVSTWDATSRRFDLRAAEALRDSAQILAEAAAANLRRRFDVSVRAGVRNVYRSPYFRVLKDEFVRDSYEPREPALDYFHPKGIGRTFQQRWEPEFAFKFTFSIPFKNRRAEGRLLQARASLRDSDVRAADLARVVEQNVTDRAWVLQRTRAALERKAESVRQHELTWRATQYLRQAGEITLIDALITEQDLTSAQLDLVAARRDDTLALARLRFETGTLVRFDHGQPSFSLGGLTVHLEGD